MVADSWAVCARMAKRHYENFPVGSLLFPKRLRRPLWAIYAYCRTVDDLGDEAPGDRAAHLDVLEEELRATLSGTPTLPIMKALAETITQHRLPEQPFFDLIEANRRDQRVARYDTWSDLLEYCRFSANPVGRLVLALIGEDTPGNRRFSDATCTALQLTNFWQDVPVDWEKGRVYIPQSEMARAGYTMEMLARRTLNDEWRRLMGSLLEKTRALFHAGAPLLGKLSGRVRTEVALFTLGGMQVLNLIEREGYDVWTRPLRLSRRAKGRLFWQAVWEYGPWRRSR